MCRFVEIRYSYSRHICAVISMAWHVCTVIYGQWSSQQTGHGDHWCPAAVTELAADRVCAWTIVLCQRSFFQQCENIPHTPENYYLRQAMDNRCIFMTVIITVIIVKIIDHSLLQPVLPHDLQWGHVSVCTNFSADFSSCDKMCAHSRVNNKKLFEDSHSWNVVHLQCTVQKNSTMSIDFVGSQLFISFSLVHLCVCVCVCVCVCTITEKLRKLSYSTTMV